VSRETWNEVDDYIVRTLVHEDGALLEASRVNASEGLPPIAVSPNQGKLLHLLVQISAARKILEIGTLGGYSTIWLARALPEGGSLITLEADPKHAEVARSNIERAEVSSVVEIRLGPALETLAELEAESAEPFDFVFIDADKPSTAHYLSWAIDHSRSGAIIVVDNVVREGRIIEEDSDDPGIRAIREANQILGSDSRVLATEIQTVGTKGYDGFAVVVVS